MSDVIERARRVADEVLAPCAAQVDATGTIPSGHFAVLAEEGFYGIAVPPEHGGPGVELADRAAVTEIFAGSCLATTFTWMQHHGAAHGLATTDNAALRAAHLGPALRGELRCGVAFAGAVPQPPKLLATRVEGGWRLDGEAPLVTGWGIVDRLQISARDASTTGEPDETARIVGLLVEPSVGPDTGTVTVHPLELAAANASRTVRLEVHGWFVPDAHVVSTSTRAQFLAGLAASSRINGCLPLGVAGHAVRLVAEAGEQELGASLGADLDDARRELDAAAGPDAGPEEVYAARAGAAALAARAATAAVVAVGSSGIVGTHPAQRLVREAAFTLVAGGRPEIKAGLRQRLAA